HGSSNPAARKFIEVLRSAEGRSILRRYGFTVKP
ncbi:MAG: substrate-binding domain-containing protein, partial [Ilumatobacteraceae bacterium]